MLLQSYLLYTNNELDLKGPKTYKQNVRESKTKTCVIFLLCRTGKDSPNPFSWYFKKCKKEENVILAINNLHTAL